ncbi:hypothetical protein C5167_042891 [Papaver somniferum]|uniref:Uncharacterized protein n=1 Tax=Papaver somniferum TaxID=3469 RepID=A0A4Y7L433_PAPSO|nr:hypothetical protein C5167_042891 [Papaver somniferum]
MALRYECKFNFIGFKAHRTKCTAPVAMGKLKGLRCYHGSV